jgi:predicted amidophosphoribosyltransferase
MIVVAVYDWKTSVQEEAFDPIKKLCKLYKLNYQTREVNRELREDKEISEFPAFQLYYRGEHKHTVYSIDILKLAIEEVLAQERYTRVREPPSLLPRVFSWNKLWKNTFN